MIVIAGIALSALLISLFCRTELLSKLRKLMDGFLDNQAKLNFTVTDKVESTIRKDVTHMVKVRQFIPYLYPTTA